nr:3727_t:CDS:2 [Entrophospora candida]
MSSITTVFSHAQTVVLCGSCANVLCQPTGGRARLTEGIKKIEIVAHLERKSVKNHY